MTLTTWEGPLPLQPQPGQAVVRLPSIDELVEAWPKVAPLLQRATVRTGCYEPIDILRLAMVGQVGVWFCEVEEELAAVLVSEVKQYPRRRILEMLFAGGSKLRSWIAPAVAALDEHAKQMGCSHVTTIGRPGWTRAWRAEVTGDVVLVRAIGGRNV